MYVDDVYIDLYDVYCAYNVYKMPSHLISLSRQDSTSITLQHLSVVNMIARWGFSINTQFSDDKLAVDTSLYRLLN